MHPALARPGYWDSPGLALDADVIKMENNAHAHDIKYGWDDFSTVESYSYAVGVFCGKKTGKDAVQLHSQPEDVIYFTVKIEFLYGENVGRRYDQWETHDRDDVDHMRVRVSLKWDAQTNY